MPLAAVAAAEGCRKGRLDLLCLSTGCRLYPSDVPLERQDRVSGSANTSTSSVLPFADDSTSAEMGPVPVHQVVMHLDCSQELYVIMLLVEHSQSPLQVHDRLLHISGTNLQMTHHDSAMYQTVIDNISKPLEISNPHIDFLDSFMQLPGPRACRHVLGLL